MRKKAGDCASANVAPRTADPRTMPAESRRALVMKLTSFPHSFGNGMPKNGRCRAACRSHSRRGGGTSGLPGGAVPEYARKLPAAHPAASRGDALEEAIGIAACRERGVQYGENC